jgi:hypothetical protein
MKPPTADTPPVRGCQLVAYETVGQVGIDGHDVHPGVAQEPVNNVLPGRP